MVKATDHEGELWLLIDCPSLSLNNSRELKEELLEYLRNPQKVFVMDFSKVQLVDSSALGVIVSFQKELNDLKKALAVANLGQNVRELMENIRMDKFLSIRT